MMSFPPNAPTSSSQMSTPGMPTPVSELPQAQVDAIIRTKRKAREPKACYPCHTRKVKCDRNLPCDGCVKRDHADLCSYERPSQKRQAVTQPHPERDIRESSVLKAIPADVQPDATDAGRVSISREEWDNVCSKLKDVEQTISSLRVGLDHGASRQAVSPELKVEDSQGIPEQDIPEREGIHASTELGNGTTYLGSRSVLAYLSRKSGASQETAQALFEGGILPKLGLDNESATYPFIDLWSADNSTLDINTVCSALPDDNQCQMLFQYYREIAATVYPVIPDIDHFEANLNLLLQNRSAFNDMNMNATGEDMEKPYGMSVGFIGLLFAVLAAGCQSSDLPGKDRELTSQVYVCCSYQCLRCANFMSRPNIEAIQTLLTIGNVLSYNMNPGVSYILLGMTIRMGQAMGLQVESQRFSPDERFIRRRVWWSMAWQDSHYSLSYDRPSTMAFSHPDIPYTLESTPGRRSFFETLSRVIALTLEIVRGRMLSPNTQMSFKVIQAYKEQVKDILDDAGPQLHDRSLCKSPKENLERLGLKLHSSYITSELCRPALKSEFDSGDTVAAALRKDCISALTRTVEAYVEIHAINPHASRSWIGLQRTISSAFLLVVIPESKSNPHVWSLLRQLETVIADRAAADGALDQSAGTGNRASAAPMTSPELSKPGADFSNITDGVTNVPNSAFEPNLATFPTSIPATVPANIETQWSKPLLKSLRALRKLNEVFNMHSRRQQQETTQAPFYQGQSLAPQYPPSTTTPSHPGTLAPGRSESMSPITPESSGSGEWTFPNLVDRASEYIHPPLWG